MISDAPPKIPSCTAAAYAGSILLDAEVLIDSCGKHDRWRVVHLSVGLDRYRVQLRRDGTTRRVILTKLPF